MNFSDHSTQALDLVRPTDTQPNGILLPFPRRGSAVDPTELPRRRDVRAPKPGPLRITDRGVAVLVAGILGSFAAASWSIVGVFL